MLPRILQLEWPVKEHRRQDNDEQAGIDHQPDTDRRPSRIEAKRMGCQEPEQDGGPHLQRFRFARCA